MKSNEYLENQIHDLKWNLIKEKDNVEEIEKIVEKRNETILKQEEEILNLQKDSNRYRMSNLENETEVEKLKDQIR